MAWPDIDVIDIVTLSHTHFGNPDSVEFQQVPMPQCFYPVGWHPQELWRSLFYANLIKDFIDEILSGSPGNQGDFADVGGALTG